MKKLFKQRHFQQDIIIWAIRWYCSYGISYRELEEMMDERGVTLDHTTIYRWVQYYAPILLKKLKSSWRSGKSKSWYVDETYIKIKGKWTYLYRAVNESGHTVDFYLSSKRNKKAAKRFLCKALRYLKQNNHPQIIHTDKHIAYKSVIRNMKKNHQCSESLLHRQEKYLNNRIESDHAKMKRLIRPVLGFKSLKTAYATIKGFELMRMFKKGQFCTSEYGQGGIGEARFIQHVLSSG